MHMICMHKSKASSSSIGTYIRTVLHAVSSVNRSKLASETLTAASKIMANSFVRLYEQLRAVWKSKDREQPFVRGYLLTRTRPPNGYNHAPPGGHQNGGKDIDSGIWETADVVERWFTLLGHALFYCTSKESAEYGGAMLTDIFSPVMARVDERTLNAFGAPETQQVRLVVGSTW